MTADAKDTACAFITALTTRDWDGLAQLLASGFSYTVQSYDLPGGGTAMDGAAMLQILPGLLTVFDDTSPRMEIKHLVSDGQWVVVEGQGSGSFRDGSPYQNRYALVFEVVDGKVRTLREYMDTGHMEKRLAAVR